MIFAGKFSFGTAAGKVLSISAKAPFRLTVATGNYNSPGPAQAFNAYGDVKTASCLQAPDPDWQYLSYQKGAGYLANKDRGDAGVASFSFETSANGSTYIVEQSGGNEYYLNVTGSSVNRLLKTGTPPPASAEFSLNQVTNDLATILGQGSTMADPLTGVYIANTDLSQVAFMATDLSYAQFPGCNFSGVNFNGATAAHTSFDGCHLNEAIAGGLTFSNCSFNKATMGGISLVSSVLQNCVLNEIDFTPLPNKLPANLQGATLDGSSMVGCDFAKSLIHDASFVGTVLINAKMKDTVGIDKVGVDFTDAVLIGTDLREKNFTKCKISTGTIFLNALLDKGIFTGMHLEGVNFSRASIPNGNFDSCKMAGVQMAFTDLSFGSFLGGVDMVGANFSNAILQSAKMAKASFGAKQVVLTLPLSAATDLDAKIVPAQMIVKLKLTQNPTVSILAQGVAWEVKNGNDNFRISKQNTQLVVARLGSNANGAVFTNAYLVNANLDQANLYAVEMNGVHWYGGSASAQSADLGLANFSNAKLSGMNFKQTLMQGATFDYAVLIGTIFDGANLSPTVNLKATSFAFCSLQSTEFRGNGTSLRFANLTNAAYAFSSGVPLFKVANTFITSLDAGKVDPDLIKAFSDAGYPLIPKPNVVVTQKGVVWHLDNIDTNNNAQTGYGTFTLEAPSKGETGVQIYGQSPLLILTQDDKNQQVQLKKAFGPTVLDRSQLNAETTCPSGMRFGLLGAYLSYEELMTAALPPKPPVDNNGWG